MPTNPLSRRQLLASATAFAAASVAGSATARSRAGAAPAVTAAATTRANDRPGFAVVGTGGLATSLSRQIPKYGDIIAACDVDRARRDKFNAERASGKAFLTGDYRDVLERKDVDCVFIATPDHWHAKIAAEAMRAGKDVYCEKPLTLTIDEGRILCRVARETGRVLQVGTQQRSDEQWQKVIALVHSGRMGRIRQVTCVIKTNTQGGPFPVSEPPAELDWDKWLGPAPLVPYIKQRCHYDFRWWYEYSGGRMTDWGAHYVDIAQWAAAPDLPGPVKIEPLEDVHPVKLRCGMPDCADCYNTPKRFNVKCTFANDVELFITDVVPGAEQIDNGILFVGEKQTLFVNRKEFRGDAADALAADPPPASALAAVRNGRDVMPHMANFVACCRDRGTPASDVWSHHRHLTTCHLANIALRLNRAIQWDATSQRIIGDRVADSFQSRPQRKGYELV
jgi:predicted dehydrogenase